MTDKTPAMPELPEPELRAIYQRHELATAGLVMSDFKRIASEVLALATLQAQPAAAVSDAEIDAVSVAQWGPHRGAPLAAHRAFARAILALRPAQQAVPMSHHDVVVMQFKLGPKFNDMTIGDLQMIVTAVEAHHGITQRADGGEVDRG